jgi:hypothetical protein
MTTTTIPSTVTNIPSGLEHNRDKVSGFAILLEFIDEALVNQTLIFSEMVSPVTGDIMPMHTKSRVLSPARPKRSWREITPRDFKSAATIAPSKRLIRKTDTQSAIEHAVEYFDSILTTIDGLAVSSWKLVHPPVVVEVSEADAISMHKGESPRDLFERLHKIRLEQQFPELPTNTGGN